MSGERRSLSGKVTAIKGHKVCVGRHSWHYKSPKVLLLRIPGEERHRQLPGAGILCGKQFTAVGNRQAAPIRMRNAAHYRRVRESFPRKNNPITLAKEPREGARLNQNLQHGTDE